MKKHLRFLLTALLACVGICSWADSGDVVTTLADIQDIKAYHLSVQRGWLREDIGTNACTTDESTAATWALIQSPTQPGHYYIYLTNSDMFLTTSAVTKGQAGAEFYLDVPNGNFTIEENGGTFIIISNQTGNWMQLGGSAQFVLNDANWKAKDAGNQWTITEVYDMDSDQLFVAMAAINEYEGNLEPPTPATLYVTTSTAEAPVWYTIASYNRGGVLTAEEDGSLTHVAKNSNSYWWFELVDEMTGALVAHNFNGKVINGAWTVGDTPMNVYILPNGVNDEGYVICRNANSVAGNCLDASNANVSVGTWGPSAGDWQGTTWVFATAPTDPETMTNINALCTTLQTLNCVGGYRATAEQVAALGQALDNYDMAAAMAVISQLDEYVDLSADKKYVFNCERGNWIAQAVAYSEGEADAICGTAKFGIEPDNNSPAQQWAVVTLGEQTYLYSVGAQKFVAASGCQLTTTAPAGTIRLEEGADAVYSWIVRVGDNYVNTGEAASTYKEGLIINSYGGANQWDGGNQYRIIEVGDFDPAEAIAAIINAAAQADMERLEALQADLTQFILGKEEYIQADVRQAIETIMGDSWSTAIFGAYQDAVENSAAYVSPDFWTTLETQIAWVKEQIEGVQNGTIVLYTENGVVGGDPTFAEMPYFNTEVGVEVYTNRVVIKAWDGVEGSDLTVAYAGVQVEDEIITRITGIEQTVNGEVVSETFEDEDLDVDDEQYLSVVLRPQDGKYAQVVVYPNYELSAVQLGEAEEAGMGQLSLFAAWYAAAGEGEDPGFGMDVQYNFYSVVWPGEAVEAGVEVGNYELSCDIVNQDIKQFDQLEITFSEWDAAGFISGKVVAENGAEVELDGGSVADEDKPNTIWVGTYEGEEITAAGDYTLNVTVQLYKADAAPAPGMRRAGAVVTLNIPFTVDENSGIATGVAAIQAAAKAAIFNLNGQAVKSAQQGLYIINGKKAVVK